MGAPEKGTMLEEIMGTKMRGWPKCEVVKFERYSELIKFGGDSVFIGR